MGKAGIKRWEGVSKGGAGPQSNSWATGSLKAKTARSILEVNFCKTASWNRAFERSNSTGESTDLPAAKETQLWPKVMRKPEIPVALHGQQKPHTQGYAEQLVSARKWHSLASTVLYPH